MLVPFLLWSLFYMVLKILMLQRKQQAVNWGKIIFDFFTGQTIAPLYFIIVLTQFTLLTPLLVRLLKKESAWVNTFCLLLTPLYLLCVYFWNFIYGSQPLLYGTFFPAWFLFYYLGLRYRDGKVLCSGSLFGVIVALVLSCAEALLLYYQGASMGLYLSQLTFGSVLYALAIIGFAFKEQNLPELAKFRYCDIFAKIGDCSYGIYFVHIAVLGVSGKIAQIIGINQNWYLFWSFRFLFTVLLSWGFVRVAQLLFNEHKKWLFCLGLE